MEMPYKSEAAFGHALDKVLKEKGYDVHNIQTPTTERGCPDRFIQKGRLSAWIELKNAHYSIRTPILEVHYREGQQAWLYQHYKHGGKGFLMIAGEDGYIIYQQQGVLKDKLYAQRTWPQLIMSHLYSNTLDQWLLQFAY